jgi:xylulose-5-phosphate/fructose-6-phosphate phosphoketolase
MAVLNDVDRLHRVSDAIERLPQLPGQAGFIKQQLCDRLIEHWEHVREHCEDRPGICRWRSTS